MNYLKIGKPLAYSFGILAIALAGANARAFGPVSADQADQVEEANKKLPRERTTKIEEKTLPQVTVEIKPIENVQEKKIVKDDEKVVVAAATATPEPTTDVLLDGADLEKLGLKASVSGKLIGLSGSAPSVCFDEQHMKVHDVKRIAAPASDEEELKDLASLDKRADKVGVSYDFMATQSVPSLDACLKAHEKDPKVELSQKQNLQREALDLEEISVVGLLDKNGDVHHRKDDAASIHYARLARFLAKPDAYKTCTSGNCLSSALKDFSETDVKLLRTPILDILQAQMDNLAKDIKNAKSLDELRIVLKGLDLQSHTLKSLGLDDESLDAANAAIHELYYEVAKKTEDIARKDGSSKTADRSKDRKGRLIRDRGDYATSKYTDFLGDLYAKIGGLPDTSSDEKDELDNLSDDYSTCSNQSLRKKSGDLIGKQCLKFSIDTNTNKKAVEVARERTDAAFKSAYVDAYGDPAHRISGSCNWKTQFSRVLADSCAAARKELEDLSAYTQVSGLAAYVQASQPAVPQNGPLLNNGMPGQMSGQMPNQMSFYGNGNPNQQMPLNGFYGNGQQPNQYLAPTNGMSPPNYPYQTNPAGSFTSNPAPYQAFNSSPMSMNVGNDLIAGGMHTVH